VRGPAGPEPRPAAGSKGRLELHLTTRPGPDRRRPVTPESLRAGNSGSLERPPVCGSPRDCATPR
jgi:hypothetical protein